MKRWFEALPLEEKIHEPRPINAVVDATFFGKRGMHQWGVLVFRDPVKKENLYWSIIDEERIVYYQEGRRFLEDLGYTFLSVTMDGLRGLANVFNDIPVQFCHFHQKQIIRRYVTKNPRLDAGRALKEAVETLTHSNEKQFTHDLNSYIDQYRGFLNEKTTGPVTGTWSFTHKRLRSAIRSLQANLPQLYTYQKYPHFTISTTTNSLESHFGHIKDMVCTPNLRTII